MLINPQMDLAVTGQPPMKADEGTARIPLALLPGAVKAGDRVSLTITGIDSVAGTATVVADNPTNAVPEPAVEAVNTDVTMGPIDDLKSYLYKKTMEKEA